MIEPEHAPRLNGGARVLGTGVRHHPTMESRRPRESVVRDRLSLGATARRTRASTDRGSPCSPRPLSASVSPTTRTRGGADRMKNTDWPKDEIQRVGAPAS